MLRNLIKKAIAVEPVAKTIRRLATLTPSESAEDVFTRFEDRRLFRQLRHSERDVSRSQFTDRISYVLSDRPIPPALGQKLTDLDGLSDQQIANGVFYVYFECDNEALPHLRRITSAGGKYIPHLSFLKTDYRFTDRAVHNAMRRTWAAGDRVSHLSPVVHENVCEALSITRDVEGDYVEIGVFLGGSALTAANFIDETDLHRQLWLMDTFDGFNYPEAYASPDTIWAGTHALKGVAETMAYVGETLSSTNAVVKLVQSNICADELPSGISRIAVANIDVDMYEPTLAGLTKVAPLISPGGIIICEDPASTPSLYGAYQAMEDFLAFNRGFLKIFKKGQYFLLKK